MISEAAYFPDALASTVDKQTSACSSEERLALEISATAPKAAPQCSEGPDEELLEQVSRGDREALGALFSSTDGVDQKYTADLVVHGAGRVPEINDMDLARGGIERDRRGVIVNEYLQSTSNSSVYAAGDAASTPGLRLTPVASMEGDVIATNLLGGNHRKPNYAGIPTVVFTNPPLASVGFLEEEATKRGLKCRINHQNSTDWYSSKRTGIRRSGFKVVIDENSDLILGAHLLGPNAEEVINMFGLAIRFGLRSSDLREMAYSYPTSASDIPYML